MGCASLPKHYLHPRHDGPGAKRQAHPFDILHRQVVIIRMNIIAPEKQTTLQSLSQNRAAWLSVIKALLFVALMSQLFSPWSEASQQRNIEKGIEGIEGFSFRWDNDQSGGFSFSIKNRLEYPITDIMVMVVFYNYSGSVIDFQELDFTLCLPAGLSKRLRGKVDSSTLEIVNEIDPNRLPEFRGKEAALKWLKNRKESGPKRGWIEIRVLDFKKFQQDK